MESSKVPPKNRIALFPDHPILTPAIKIICVVFGIYFLVKQYYYTPNIPFGDDLPTIFHFLFNYDQAPTLSEKISIIFNNRMVEHRLLSLSVISAFIYQLSGDIPLPVLSTIAGLMWVSISFFYYTILKRRNLSILWLVPILCFLLSFSPYQPFLWPMAAMQHLIVISLAFLTVFLLANHDHSGPSGWRTFFFPVSIFVGILTTFSAGNGMLIWPTGFLILVIQRRIKPLVYWLIAAILAIGGYFYRLSLDGTPSNQALEKILANYGKEIIGFFAGLGSAIRTKGYETFLDDNDLPFSLKYPAIYLGILITFVFIALFVKSVKTRERNSLSILGASAFIFLTVATLVVGRTNMNGDIIAFKSRYYLYAVIAISNAISTVALLIPSYKYKEIILAACFALGLVFWGVWEVVSFHKIINHHNMLDAALFNWHRNHKWIMYQPSAFYENYFNGFFEKTEKSAFPYRLPPSRISQAFQHKQWRDDFFPKAQPVELVEKSGDKKLVQIKLVNEQAAPIHGIDEGYSVVMASEKDTFMLWSIVSPTGVRNFLKNRETCRKGYRVEVELDRDKMPKGTYWFHQFYYSGDRSVINKQPAGSIVF
ncbi:hypothetical protein ACFPMF_07845 [Larkinella bovis]|uniref:Glycosyltransferase RgtA/B/C/D-like domain-containing protein n=1 Tax=Larkinella bovis TaxID=683041 RepID=A0ABW0I7H0_9BACT